MKNIALAISLLFVVAASAQKQPSGKKDTTHERWKIAAEMDKSIRTELLNKWYPRSVDSLYGGFLSTFTYDFQPTGSQDKMIVTQARHVWSNAIASGLYPDVAYYKQCAAHGFAFLQNVMWDKVNGGFYTLVDRKGNVKDSTGKMTYGNAFGIYASAAWFRASGDTNALRLARKCFWWLEKIATTLYIKAIIKTSCRMAHPLKELPLLLPLRLWDIKIRILLFIYWKRLRNSMPYGPTRC